MGSHEYGFCMAKKLKASTLKRRSYQLTPRETHISWIRWAHNAPKEERPKLFLAVARELIKQATNSEGATSRTT